MTTPSIDIPPPPATTARTSRSSGQETLKWSRLVHVYTSMIAFLVILFFGLTGITLNHPTWTLGDGVNTITSQGVLSVEPVTPSGQVDFLTISEFARNELGVSGAVSSFNATGHQGEISYRKAGYSADLFFDTDTKAYDLTVEQQGWVGVLNDLHKGRDTGSSWKWLIDIAAGFLVIISLTGLLMQFFLKRRRTSAYISAGVGAVLLVMLVVQTIR